MSDNQEYLQLSQYVEDLKSSLREMVELKEKLVKSDYKDDKTMEKLLEVKQKAIFLFSRMNSVSRDLHWNVHMREQELKEPQKKLRELIDKMENVAYEKAQLTRKTKACQSHHVHLDKLKDVVTVNEFRDNGGHLLRDKEGKKIDRKKDPHTFQLRRLQFELESRQELLRQEQSIKSEVGNTQKENQERKTLIETTLTKKLNTLFTAAAPLREVFNLPRRTIGQPRNAIFLPEDLYSIFYSCWCQKHIHRDVDGTVSLKIMDAPDAPASKKRKLSDGRAVASLSGEIHPVKLCLQFDKIGVRLILHLHQPLRLILTKVSIKNSENKWVLEDPRIFSCLFPSEGHYELPLPNELKKTGRDSYLAFSWIQSLSCEFVPGDAHIARQGTASPISLVKLSHKLGERLDVQKSFIVQIKCLQKKTFIPEVENMFSRKAVSKFIAFDVSTDLKEKYYQLSTEKPNDDDVNCRFFAVTFQHGAVYLQGVMKQPPGYPQNKPILCVHYISGKFKKPEKKSIFTKLASKSMVERVINMKSLGFENSAKDIQIAVNYNLEITEENKMNTLSMMLKKLQLCFDIHMAAMKSQRNSISSSGVPVRNFHGKDRSQNFSVLTMKD